MAQLFYPNHEQPIPEHQKYEFNMPVEYFHFIKNSFLIYANDKIFLNEKKIGKIKNLTHKIFHENLILANENEIKIYNEIELRTYRFNYTLKSIAVNLLDSEKILTMSNENMIFFYSITEPESTGKLKIDSSSGPVEKIYFVGKNIFLISGKFLQVISQTGEKIFHKEFNSAIIQIEFFADTFALIFEREIFLRNFYFSISGVERIFLMENYFIFQFKNSAISIFDEKMQELFFYRPKNQLFFLKDFDEKINFTIEKFISAIEREDRLERIFHLTSSERRREGKLFFMNLKFLWAENNFIFGNFAEKKIEKNKKIESAFFIENKNRAVPVEGVIVKDDYLTRMMNRHEYRKALKYIFNNGTSENELYYFLNYAHKNKLISALLEDNRIAWLLFNYIKENPYKYELHTYYIEILKILYRNIKYGYYDKMNLIDLKSDLQIILINQRKMANLIGIF